MIPTIGRIVHYVSEVLDGQHVAAVVTQASGQTVELTLLIPRGLVFASRVEMDDDHVPGTWHWPERET